MVRIVRTCTRRGTSLVHSIFKYTIAMTVWESGRESGLLDEIIAGRKTIEGRLNRSKFTEYQVGDIVSLRRDIRDEDGVLRDGAPDVVRVMVIAVRQYPDFTSMIATEGYKKVIPTTASAQEAADEYNKYYSAEDQAHFGVLAIEIKVIH